MKNLIFAMFLSLVYTSLWSQESVPPGKESAESVEESLASVIMLPYRDKTGSKNYEYLSGSLGEAVEKSMKKNFQYRTIEAEKVKASFKKNDFNARQVYLKKGKDIPADFDTEVAKLVAADLAADMVIFGFYVFDQEANEVIIETSLYLALVKSTRSVEAVRTPVDNTIFQATEKVAVKLVEKIHEMIAEAQGQPEVAEEKPAGEKVAFTKEAAKRKEKVGHYQNSPGRGIFLSKASRTTARTIAAAPWARPTPGMPGAVGGVKIPKVGDFYNWKSRKLILSYGLFDWTLSDNLGLPDVGMYYHLTSGSVKYFVLPGVYAGAGFNMDSYALILSSLGEWTANMTLMSSQFIVGAGIPLQVIFPYVEIGFGAYWGTLSDTRSAVPREITLNVNPFITAKVGVDLIVLPFISVGNCIEWLHYSDAISPFDRWAYRLYASVTF